MIRFGHRSWRILTKIEKFVGYWPYQNKAKNLTLRIINVLLIILVLLGLILKAVEEWNNLDIVVENIIEILTILATFIKLVAICALDKRRQEIFEKIAGHFKTIIDKDEVQILREYSEKGLKFTIACLGSMFAASAIYLLMPLVRMFILYYLGRGILERKLPVYVDLLIDEHEYFYQIVFVFFFGMALASAGDVAFNLNYFLTVRHICALFQIVKHRLNTASEIVQQRDRDNKLSDEDEAKAWKLISSAVDLHNEATELAATIDDTYKICWFFILLMNAVALAPIPVMSMLYQHDSFEKCRRAAAFAIYPVHFYMIFAQGQMTMDHSESVFDTGYEFCWYDCPKRFRLAISIIMIRSFQPCRLSGVLFDLSMETYTVLMKTALSYISMFQAFIL